MTADNIDALVKGIIETQVIQALNNAPDAIEKLVKAALSRPVDASGKYDGYGNKMPYLDYMVGEEIRSAATAAVRKVILESSQLIEDEVRKGLSSETIVAAVVNSFVKTAEQDWRIDVKFEAKKDRF